MSALRPVLPSRPERLPPPGAWDCHVHLFGPRERHPLAVPRRYTPGLARPEDLRATLDRMGVAHAVIVQASPYGDDHGCLLEGLDAMEGRCAGVASFTAGARPRDGLLGRLDAAGVRGLRVHLLRSDDAEARHALREGAALANGMGWHLELHVGAGQAPLVEAARAFEGAIVLDHMARAAPADVPRLAAIPSVRVKLSGLDRHPDPAGAVPVARALLAAMPGRCLWGSDWPHTPPHPPGAAALEPAPFRAVDAGADLDAILREADAATRRAVLCDTPAALYADAALALRRAAP